MERSINAIRYRAAILGLTEDKRISSGTKWLDFEIEILKRYFPTEGYNITKRLPNRSKTSICGQASRYGLLKKRKRKIICIETQKVYESITSAVNEIGNIDIMYCLSNNCDSTAGGYHWSYIDDTKRIEKLKKFIGAEKCYKYNKARKVVCAETGVIYDSITKAESFGGKTIWACLNKKNKTANGYHWYYKDDKDAEESMKKYFGKTSDKIHKIVCYETGKTYNTIADAIIETNATTYIWKCLENPEFTSGGYHWCTEEQYKNGFSPEHPEIKNAKKVICIETKNIYNSMSEAETLLKISGISGCVHDYSKTCGGYHWCLLEDYNNELYIKKDKNKPWNCKKVRCIETNQIFDSANDAAKYVKCSTGNMNYALKDKKHKIKGYHWEYAEEENKND